MTKIEKILGVVIAVALLLQWFNIPGARFLLTISLAVLIMMYFAFSVFVINRIKTMDVFKASSYRELSAYRLIGTIFYGFITSTVCLGILYNLQNWQRAGSISIVGFIFFLIAFIVVSCKYFLTKMEFYLLLTIRIGVIGAISLLVYLFG